MSTNYGFEPTLDGLNNIDADSSTTTNIICDTITVNTSSSVPTRTAGDNTTNIANTAFVTNAVSTAGANYVTLTGASQTISSEKTFSNANTFITGALNAPTIKTTLGTSMTIATDPVGYTDDIDITTANDLTLTAGFNAVINCFQGAFGATNAMTFSSGSNINFNSTGTPGTVFNGSYVSFNNTGGTTVFNYVLPTCSIPPTTANHLCNKTYTDSVAGGAGILTTNNTFSGTNAFTNTLNLNATGTANTNIGNSLSTTYLNGNTTVSGLPIVPNYSSSSHSETTSATVLTQLNGTFRSTVTWLTWTTGTFNYVMNQIIPGVPGWVWPGGYITLAKGSYSFNYAFSFEDSAAGYNITDLRVGISTSGALTAASTDATIIASLPGGNLTCFKHYVTTITPASTDTVVEQMSGSFYLTASTTIYPFCRINNSAGGGINTVKFDLTLTRVGL